MVQHTGSVGIDTVTLVAMFVEAVLYGLLIVLSIASTVVLVRKSRLSRNPINKPMIVASVSMFILATVHIAADLQRLLDAFVRHSTDHPGGSKGYLNRVNTPIYVLKSTAYGAQTLVGDAFIIYRLHLVWDGDRRIIIPLLISFIASTGVGIGAVHGFALAAPDDPIFLKDLQHWIVSFFSLTLFTNFTSTTLIASRIWWIHRKTKTIVSGRSVLPAMVVIIESGAIYSACLIILISLYLSGSFTQYIVLDAVTQVIGVVFSLVILRVALGISSETRKTRTGRMTTLAFGGAKSEAMTTEDSEESPVAIFNGS
ncbi:hypothetical protein CVT25_013899 [Psilocybe cyanescens]|uniref:Uncharacterized protein n=1 Tax=Psilocybe cyanescens TaxID=93625 RepID=A0A409XZ28_PSICY|nr:hypothetical protein CVT25_013899 [Psilocybe cyanescens]